MPWATAIEPVELNVFAWGNVKPPEPLFVNPPEPLIVEFNSKAPPLIAKLALLASVMGVLIDCVPLLTVTVAAPLLPLSVKLPLLSV